MKIHWTRLLALLCVVGVLAPAATASAFTTWAHEGWTKAGNWTLGGDIRIRWLSTQDMANMGTPGFITAGGKDTPLGTWNTIEIWRQRGRLWVKADLPKNITTYFRMTQEIRWGETASNLPAGAVFGREDRWAMILDNAWMQIAEPFDLPITLKGGRMDMRYGQCWLICDSDSAYSGDGSRTFFFDAAKATLHVKAIETDVDFLYSQVHEINFNLGTDDDNLYGVYITSLVAKPLKIETYMFCRDQKKDRVESAQAGLGVGINHPARTSYTYGARLSGKWGVFSFAAEGAAQQGTIDNIAAFWIKNSVETPGTAQQYYYKSNDPAGKVAPAAESAEILAYGGYVHAGCHFKDVPLKPSFRIGYWFYSGDDRNSGKWGGFDDLFGQAPLYGEYYLYSHLDLTSSPNSDWDPFFHTNMHFPKLELGAEILPNLTLTLIYQHFFAHRNTYPTTFTDSKGGLNRGDYVIGVLGYDFSEHLACHLRWEAFFPGDYYAANAADVGQFGRVEFLAKF